MKAREILLLLGTVGAIGAAAFVIFGSGGAPALAGPTQATSEPAPALPPPPAGPAAPLPVAVPGPGTTARGAAPTLPPGERPTSGTIDGSIRLSTELAGKIEHFTVVVEEELNGGDGSARPFSLNRSFPVEPNRTPRFLIDSVPFSACGYRVAAFTPGANGSTQVIQLTEEQWLAQVSLALTPGIPFSLRLRDQHMNARAGLDVVMRPDGWPNGRPELRGTTDGYGSVVFESALAGDYRVLVADQQIGTVQVQSTALTTNLRNVSVQSAILEVAVGPALRIEVTGPAGYGIENAKIEVYAIDTVENRRLQGTTDHAGVREFAHVAPGQYQVDVSAEGFLPTNRTVKVPADGELEPLRIRLVN
jgi:hypothetical protein